MTPRTKRTLILGFAFTFLFCLGRYSAGAGGFVNLLLLAGLWTLASWGSSE